jgi:hypothetical protein
MSAPVDLHAVHLTVSLCLRAVADIRSKCQDQRLRINTQRERLRAHRTQRLARKAKQNDKLGELYISLGLVKRLE